MHLNRRSLNKSNIFDAFVFYFLNENQIVPFAVKYQWHSYVTRNTRHFVNLTCSYLRYLIPFLLLSFVHLYFYNWINVKAHLTKS